MVENYDKANFPEEKRWFRKKSPGEKFAIKEQRRQEKITKYKAVIANAKRQAQLEHYKRQAFKSKWGGAGYKLAQAENNAIKAGIRLVGKAYHESQMKKHGIKMRRHSSNPQQLVIHVSQPRQRYLRVSRRRKPVSRSSFRTVRKKRKKKEDDYSEWFKV